MYGVAVGVCVGVTVRVGVCVGVTVRVGVGVLVGVWVGAEGCRHLSKGFREWKNLTYSNLNLSLYKINYF